MGDRARVSSSVDDVNIRNELCTVRWLGVLPDDPSRQAMVGVEFVSDISLFCPPVVVSFDVLSFFLFFFFFLLLLL